MRGDGVDREGSVEGTDVDGVASGGFTCDDMATRETRIAAAVTAVADAGDGGGDGCGGSWP